MDIVEGVSNIFFILVCSNVILKKFRKRVSFHKCGLGLNIIANALQFDNGDFPSINCENGTDNVKTRKIKTCFTDINYFLPRHCPLRFRVGDKLSEDFPAVSLSEQSSQFQPQTTDFVAKHFLLPSNHLNLAQIFFPGTR